MSEPIKVGDLVCVVRAGSCCGHSTRMGEIFRVEHLRHAYQCAGCGDRHTELSALGNSFRRGMRLSRLKRIPPLSELEGEKNKEELTA